MTIDELLKEASPRPWVVSDYLDIGEYGILENDNKIVVTSSKNQAKLNLKLIVLAVNNFERMRDALRKIEDDSGHHCGNSGYDPCNCNQDLASEALKEIDK